jgi:RNA polymerase sigma factor (sigma-70 family)|tara:strand:- start:49 stop:399 length:351 start_codon:yes stop_codon:yes gene_type:complete
MTHMTAGVFKNRYMAGRKFFAKYKSEDVESLDDVDLTVNSDDHIEQLELSNTIRDVLLTLTAREERVIRERFLNEKKLSEVGQLFNVNSERIRQIEAKALRKMKHPKISRELRGFL